jgi:hypothetical protein
MKSVVWIIGILAFVIAVIMIVGYLIALEKRLKFIVKKMGNRESLINSYHVDTNLQSILKSLEHNDIKFQQR